MKKASYVMALVAALGLFAGSQSAFAQSGNPRFDRFRDFDRNNDGLITRSEWHNSPAEFRTLDRNRDNVISRAEFNNFQRVTGTSGRIAPRTFPNAYMAGYEHGWADGHFAGRHDRDGNRRWNAEGHRQLRSANSGYEERFGSRAQFQQGYREGFRSAYGEGWDRR
jgi:EF hand